jgi:hypothetical protein
MAFQLHKHIYRLDIWPFWQGKSGLKWLISSLDLLAHEPSALSHRVYRSTTVQFATA